MRFDIPITIAVDANNEQQAERQVFEFLRSSASEFDKIYRVIDWQYFEFLPEEEWTTDVNCSNIGC